MQRTMSHPDPVFLLNNPTMRALVGALFALGTLSFFSLGAGNVDQFFQGIGLQLIGAVILVMVLDLWARSQLQPALQRQPSVERDESDFSFSEKPLWLRRLELREVSRQNRDSALPRDSR